jgi:hypothetical protein
MINRAPQPGQRAVPFESGRAHPGQLNTWISVPPIARSCSSGVTFSADLPRSRFVVI